MGAQQACLLRLAVVVVALGAGAMAEPLAAARETPLAARAPAELRLLRSAPGAGERLAAVTEVRLWFSEAPEVAVSRIRVDRGDQRVATGAVRAGDARDLVVSFTDGRLPAGSYAVTWRTAGADLVTMRGRFDFEVAATR